MNPAQARLCKKNISVIVAKIRQIYKSIRSTIKRALGREPSLKPLYYVKLYEIIMSDNKDLSEVMRLLRTISHNVR